MTKKTILYLTGVIVSFIIVGGVFLFMWNRNKEVPNQRGMLVVNGESVITESVEIHFKEDANYADLPFTEIMKKLGIDVDWLDNNTAEVTYNDNKYILKLSEASLIELEQNFNLLLTPPGGKKSYKILEGEMILDSNTMQSALYQMGIKINIDIDCDKLIVYITERIE